MCVIGDQEVTYFFLGFKIFSDGKNEGSPQKISIFLLQSFVNTLIEFTDYWSTHILLPSYNEKAWDKCHTQGLESSPQCGDLALTIGVAQANYYCSWRMTLPPQQEGRDELP